MATNTWDIHQLILTTLRLMDADILPLAEGNALLEELEAIKQVSEQTTLEGSVSDDASLSYVAKVLAQKGLPCS